MSYYEKINTDFEKVETWLSKYPLSNSQAYFSIFVLLLIGKAIIVLAKEIQESAQIIARRSR